MGSPWPSPETLSLSFAADGTRVGDATSSLDAEMAAAGSDAAWQREILRAFQTWAVYTNANIALVADGGAAFGTPGQIQGDFRFGDIRIGAVPLSQDSLANASPFDWSIGTWSGDVLFNTRSQFAINPSWTSTAADLYTVALHEAGHVFGMEHSDDPRSAMYETYAGRKTGLTGADIAALQSFYGARQPDAQEGRYGNNSFSTATPVDSIIGSSNLTADLQNRDDIDTYSLLNTSLLGGLTVNVKTSGISLLRAKVQIYDTWGRLLASKTAAGPGQDVSLDIPKTLLNLGYRIRVSGATDDVFGIGGYEMSVVRTDGLTLLPYLVETLANNTLLGALPLLNLGSSEPNHERSGAEADLDSTSDVDYYSVAVPATTDANDRAMVVSVVNTSGKVHPDLGVFDALGRPVDFHVLNNDGSTLSIQVLGVNRGDTFYARVWNPAGADATGRYQLTADFQPPTENQLKLLDAGHLDASRTTGGGTLKVNVARLYQFSLASEADAPTGATLNLTIRDSKGKLLLSLTKGAADPAVNQSLYLNPGLYSVVVTMSVPSGTAVPDVNYWVYLGVESDPVGPYEPGTDDGTYEEPSSDPYASSDPYSDPYSDPTWDNTTYSSSDTEYESAYSMSEPDGYYYSF
jgi:hypothetical protein